MPQVGRFALVFTENPPAVDVFKDTEFLDKGGLFAVGARRRVKRPSWTETEGSILSIGLKSKLLSLKVDSEGVIRADIAKEETIENRYQELLKKKAREGQSAREQHLQNIARNMLTNGPDLQTQRTDKRAPKRRRPSILAELEERLEQLPCFTEQEGDACLSKSDGVFLFASVLLMLQMLHPTNPNLLFNAILDRVLPKDITCNEALSRTGRYDTIAVPERVVRAVNVSVMDFCATKGISVTYNLKTLVSNFLTYRQGKAKKSASQPPSTSSLSPQFSSSSLSVTMDLSSKHMSQPPSPSTTPPSPPHLNEELVQHYPSSIIPLVPNNSIEKNVSNTDGDVFTLLTPVSTSHHLESFIV